MNIKLHILLKIKPLLYSCPLLSTIPVVHYQSRPLEFTDLSTQWYMAKLAVNEFALNCQRVGHDLSTSWLQWFLSLSTNWSMTNLYQLVCQWICTWPSKVSTTWHVNQLACLRNDLYSYSLLVSSVPVSLYILGYWWWYQCSTRPFGHGAAPRPLRHAWRPLCHAWKFL